MMATPDNDPNYKKLVSLINEALYDAYESVPALGVGADASMDQAVVAAKAVWPLIHHYRSVLANTKIKLDVLSENIEMQLNIT